MTGHDLWQEGRLAEAVAAETADVKAHPTQPEPRYRLFAFLCFQGDLVRADRQLDALGVQDQKLETSTSIYRNLLASEAERRRVWNEGADPLLPPDAPEWIGRRLDSIRAAAAGEEDRARSAREAARTGETGATGRCGDFEFAAVLDTDDFLEPVLEVFAGGRYLWLPFDHVKHLEIQVPRHVLDVLWPSAKITDRGGQTADVHLPALYPGSHEGPSDGVRLGRTTEWYEWGGGRRGRGQKVLFLSAAGGGEDSECAILSIRDLSVNAPPGPPAEDG